MSKRSPEYQSLCLITYRTLAGELETCAVPTAQRNALLATGRVTADHGFVEVGLPVKELQAALQAMPNVVAVNGGKFLTVVSATPWVPTSRTH